MIFSNFEELAINEQRNMLLNLAEAGIRSAMPSVFMPENIRLSKSRLIIKNKIFSIKNKRIFVIGAGKASAGMAVELERIIGSENIAGGVVISNYAKSRPKKIELHVADHPVPTERSLNGARKILELKNKFKLTKDDLIIALISGGGSSLMAYPVNEISLNDKKKMVELLIASGANVHEMTIIKKKVSQVKGGKLAGHFYPTPVISLVLSDVVGNDLQVIASGPLTKDSTTFKDAWRIIEKYKLKDKLPKSITHYIKKNVDNDKEQNLSHVYQLVLAENATILQAIKAKAEKYGIKAIIKKNIKGESKEVAKNICLELNTAKILPPVLFLYGGETTVTLNNPHGKGGRNQEFILACLNYLDKDKFDKFNWAAASIATDGIDHIPESSGAIIDKKSFDIIEKYNLDINKYLKNHDSHNLLKKINSNIYVRGGTGTNVCDVMMFLFLPKT